MNYRWNGMAYEFDNPGQQYNYNQVGPGMWTQQQAGNPYAPVTRMGVNQTWLQNLGNRQWMGQNRAPTPMYGGQTGSLNPNGYYYSGGQRVSPEQFQQEMIESSRQAQERQAFANQHRSQQNYLANNSAMLAAQGMNPNAVRGIQNSLSQLPQYGGAGRQQAAHPGMTPQKHMNWAIGSGLDFTGMRNPMWPGGSQYNAHQQVPIQQAPPAITPQQANPYAGQQTNGFASLGTEAMYRPSRWNDANEYRLAMSQNPLVQPERQKWSTPNEAWGAAFGRDPGMAQRYGGQSPGIYQPQPGENRWWLPRTNDYMNDLVPGREYRHRISGGHRQPTNDEIAQSYGFRGAFDPAIQQYLSRNRVPADMVPGWAWSQFKRLSPLEQVMNNPNMRISPGSGGGFIGTGGRTYYI